MEFRDQKLTGQVTLDGNSFFDCHFEKATMVFAGGTPPTLSSCTFNDSVFKFEHAASNTVSLLRGMSEKESGLQVIVRATFPELFEG
ncbi:MAG TPA: hypothetical protein VEZ48_00615 [Sphingomonadaceae bacterium]|nr:hypothetical protein [Sphingomonadaceae bacterium]